MFQPFTVTLIEAVDTDFQETINVTINTLTIKNFVFLKGASKNADIKLI